MHLLVSLAMAASPVQQGLLVCPDATACNEDMAWVSSVGGGGPGGFQVVDFDGAFAVGAIPDGMDALGAFHVALEDLRTAVAEEHWAAAEQAADIGIAALAEWRGPIPTRELFEIHYLRGVAAVSRGHDAYQYSFREAAAIADGLDLPLPKVAARVTQAWLDEQRKLAVAGRGRLELGGGPAGTRWWVDGREVQVGSRDLLPGNHRVTAIAPGRIRSWKADVPVLPGRTSAVAPAFEVRDEAAWVLDALSAAVVSLDAPDTVKDLLADYCREAGVTELRLLRVDEVRELPVPPAVALSAPPTDRPAAAAGEAVNLGDGIPTTFEGEVSQRFNALSESHVGEVRRLRMAFFDPGTRRFSADTMSSTALRPAPERLRVGASGTTLIAMGRVHFGAEAGLSVPIGPLLGEARLGVARADEPYAFYPGWVDRQIYAVSVGATWQPAATAEWVVAPRVGVAADVYVPVAFGGHVILGAEATIARGWAADLELRGGWLDQGPQAGGSVGLTRGF